MQLFWHLWYLTGLPRIYMILSAVGWLWLMIVLVFFRMKRKQLSRDSSVTHEK